MKLSTVEDDVEIFMSPRTVSRRIQLIARTSSKN